MLQIHEQIPHFTATSHDGTLVTYADVWQRRNLLLVLLGAEHSKDAERYVNQLQASMPELTAHDTACVLTYEPVPGAPRRGVVVADRWGEIYLVARAGSVAELPPVAELLEWLRYVQMQCPECQGEAR